MNKPQQCDFIPNGSVRGALAGRKIEFDREYLSSITIRCTGLINANPTLIDTDFGLLLGTVDYKSPEQAFGHKVDYLFIVKENQPTRKCCKPDWIMRTSTAAKVSRIT